MNAAAGAEDGDEGGADGPTHGVRYDLVFDASRSSAELAVYRGTASRAGASVAVEVEVEPGAVRGRALGEAPEGLADAAERAAVLARNVVKTALAEGRTPPRRVTRWRP